jgi:probable HAF family extracellular repeat protein
MNSLRTFAFVSLMALTNSSAEAAGPYKLTDLDTIAGVGDSNARSINAIGQVVGRSYAPNDYRAFLWSPNHPNGTTGSMIDLGVVVDGDRDSQAFGINSFGQVVERVSGNIRNPVTADSCGRPIR